MRPRPLVLLPMVFTAALLVLATGVPAGTARDQVLRAGTDLAKVAALAGLASAALAFRGGDYLRRGWGLYAGCLALLLLREAFFLLGGSPGSGAVAQAQVALVVLANLSGAAGAVMLARAWRVGGLDLPGSEWQRRALLAFTVALALVASGPATMETLPGLRRGAPSALMGLASNLGDAVALSVMAPLLLTAIALRGGLLLLPWGLFFACQVFWLGYDAASGLARLTSLPEPTIQLIEEGCRSMALCLATAAGLAQRGALSRVAALSTAAAT